MARRTPLLAIVCLTFLLAGAGHDDNVEWAGVTHIDWRERLPICPVDGESFSISFQTYYYDITAAGVWVDDGTPTWIAADYSHNRGVYDVWTAVIPATSPTGTLEYYIELTDGSDTDYLGPDGMSSSPPASGWNLDFATLSHAPLGCSMTSDGGAVFKVWAPNASSAYIAGEFNGWSASSLPMTKSGDYFTRKVTPSPTPPIIPNIEAYDQYKYVFQPGTVWKTDARGRAMNPSDNDNTYVIDPSSYTWADQDFDTPPFEEMVIYELHVGTFSGYNDGLNRMGLYHDVVDTHLDHLLYLGVNVVELMPITEFDYYESWGYNPVNNWAPEEAYGSPEDLKYMIDGLHRRGIAVVLDIVYNHFSFNGNYLWYYDGTQIYFDNPVVQTPWGSQAALWKQEVRDYYADNVLHWLEEYRVDGFRMDATRYMRDNWIFPEGYPQGWSLMQRINDNNDARKIDAISIAEELPNDEWITLPTAGDGAGFDAQWHDQFNDDVRAAIFAAAGGGNPSMSSVASAIIAWGYDSAQLVRYVEGHDEAGGDGSGIDDERLAVSIDSGDPYSDKAKGLSKLAQGLTIMTAGIPMFLQGGEWLEDRKFNSGWNNRIDWSKAVSRPEMTLFFRDAIGPRKSNCGLRADAPSNVYEINDTSEVIAFRRGESNEIVVVVNFSDSNYSDYYLSFPADGTWYEILNSQALEYSGNGWGNGGQVSVSGGGAQIVIPRWSLLVFRYEDPLGRDSDLDGDSDVDLHDYAVLQHNAGLQGCGMYVDIRENGRVDYDDFAEMEQYLAGPHY
ncbi:MAG: alpha amylase C-terminal domain-containing protein [Phycisphaerae bacterium]|nr:alpha amylase C-terminal domain-containing protein [Phycisphaerae bacterium]